MTYVDAYEHAIAQLRGCTILAVRYLEFPSDDDTPTWNLPSFDVLHCGLELDTDQGSMFAFTWDARDPDYGIAVTHQSVAEAFTTELTMWDVTATSRWASYIGVPITHTTVTWAYPQFLSHQVPATPLTIELTFAHDARVSIVYGGYQEFDRHGTIADALTIVFDDEVARTRNIGRYMPVEYHYRP